MRKVQDFRSLYEAELKPSLLVLDDERKKIANKIMLYAAIGLSVCLLLLFVGASFFPFIFLVAGLLFFYHYHAKKFRERYKHEIIRTLVEHEDLRYAHNNCIPKADYQRSKIFLDSINRYYGDDLVTGEVGKTAIRFSELHTKIVTGSGKNRSERTVFRGIFFIGEFNKNFVGETFVLPDVSENLLGSFGSFLQGLNVMRPQLVKLEDVDFEKAFVVYGTNQVEARYILSPALMQRILHFKNKINKSIALSFIDCHVCIAISINKNLFEAPSLFSTVDDYALLTEYQGYIQMCVDIVEELDLNTRIWTKE